MSALRNIQKGGSPKAKPKAGSSQAKATEKDLQKLRRMDLLELLIDQVRENEKLNTSVEELTDLSERLKERLDVKDAQIEHLKQRLDMKDAQIAELQNQNRAMAHAVNTFDIEEILEVQRHALRSYFESLSGDMTMSAAMVDGYANEAPFNSAEPIVGYVEDSAQGFAPGFAQEPVQDFAPGFAQEPAQDFIQDYVQDIAQEPAQDPAQDFVQDPAQDL